MDKVLSLKEIAEHLGRPASTVRLWKYDRLDYPQLERMKIIGMMIGRMVVKCALRCTRY